MGRMTLQVWRPLGQIIDPASAANGSWWASHASYPTAMANPDGSITVLFSVRDTANRSALAAIDLHIDRKRIELLGSVRGPLLGPGPRGAFDADGVTVSSVLRVDDRLFAYYLGWTVGGSVPFTNFIGLAIADAETMRFERASPAPIVGRSVENPFTVGYPWVLRRTDGFEMWFGSHLAWGTSGLDMVHVIKRAQSLDGISWVADPAVRVPLAGAIDPAEFAVSRPVVICESVGNLSMWYARRRPGYELGYASSVDGGASWQRDDRAVVFLGGRALWESHERTYPCIFEHGGGRYMLYNGNGYGRTGFGMALLEA